MWRRVRIELTPPYSSIAPVGVTQFDGRQAIELLARTTSGTQTRLFIDQQSTLIIGISLLTQSPLGEIEVSTAMGGHRSFEGYLSPTEVLITAAGQTQRFTIDNVVFGPIDDAVYDIPG